MKRSWFAWLFPSSWRDNDQSEAEESTTDSAVAVMEPPKSDHAADDAAAYGTGYADPDDESEDLSRFEEDDPRWWCPPGPRVLEAPETAADDMVDQRLLASLTQLLNAPEVELPRIPMVAQRALAELRSEEVDFKKLARLVEQDAACTTKILRVANSPAFRGIKEIKQLDRAIARLGRVEMQNTMLAMTVKSLAIQADNPRTLGGELWRRSIAKAVILEMLAPRANRSPDQMFLVGLLHDFGALAILRILFEYQRTHGRKITRRLFDVVSREWHEHIGLRLADSWNLPAPLPELIGNHHRLPGEEDPLRIDRLLIQTADASAALLKYAAFVPYDFFQLPCVRYLGLPNNASTHDLLESMPEAIESRIDVM